MIEILYVDDEHALLELGKIFLEMSKEINVDTASSVSSALKKMELTHYDAIVSDYQMPEKDGIQFLKSVRAADNTIPFILFTGKGREEVVIEALNSGANFYLQKGGDPQAQYLELEHHIKAAVHQHRADESLLKKNEELQALNQQLAVAEEELRQHLDIVIHAQDELKKEIAFSGSLSESLPGIFYVIDSQTLHMIRWNNNHRVVTGYSDEEIRGKSILDWFRPDDIEMVRSSMNECLTRGQSNIEAPIIMKDGTQVPYLLTGRRFDSINSTLIVGVGIDMTERKKIENDLRESEELFRLITDNTTDVVSVLDMDLHYTYISPSIFQLRGFTAEEAVAQPICQVLTPGSMQRVLRTLYEETESWKTGTGDPRHVRYIELEQYRKDGSIIWVGNNLSFILDKNDKPKAIIAISYDITERKKAEDILRESEARFNQLAEHSGIVTWEFDENGLFTFLSSISESVLGYRPEDVCNKVHFYDIIPEPEREAIKTVAFDTIKRRAKFVNMERPIYSKDGQLKWMSISGFPLLNADGSLRCYQGNTVDITMRRNAENELKAVNRKLNLLSGITRHDISNQILAVTGNYELFMMKNPQLRADEHLNKAKKAFDRISATIEFAQIYDDIGAQNPKWHDIGAIIGAASDQAACNQVRIINEVPSNLSIYADPLVINVFFNLIDNALRYGGKRTSVRFLLDKRDGKDLLICEDDGIGISTDMKARLFEQGFGKGHGLGLFLSREILSITGISISEEGEPGKGARFVMSIPPGGIMVQ